jgi:hypothetical protein
LGRIPFSAEVCADPFPLALRFGASGKLLISRRLSLKQALDLVGDLHPRSLRPRSGEDAVLRGHSGTLSRASVRLTLAHPSRLKPSPGWNERQNASPVVRLDAKTPNLIVDDEPLLL